MLSCQKNLLLTVGSYFFTARVGSLTTKMSLRTFNIKIVFDEIQDEMFLHIRIYTPCIEDRPRSLLLSACSTAVWLTSGLNWLID